MVQLLESIKPESDTAVVDRPAAPDRATRLLCARLYLYGSPLALIEFFRLLGPPCAGYERGVGADRREIFVHCCQSLLLSIAFLGPALVLYFFAPRESTTALAIAHSLVAVKLALLNPWLARMYFGRRPRRLRLPLLGRMAERLADAFVPWTALRSQNAIYFGGDRPFVGYGAEVNAWTVVIDTTSRTRSLSLGGELPVGADAARELETAVHAKAHTLNDAGIVVDRVLCVDGGSAAEDPGTPKLRRPPHTVSEEAARATDLAGDTGRRYVVMTSANRYRDVIVSQFVRFSKTGHLIFCEFASHLVPPVSRTVGRLDILFGYHPLVYALVGLVLYMTAAVIATYAAPFVEAPLWLGPIDYVNHIGAIGQSYPTYLLRQMTGPWFAYRIIGVTFVVLLAIVLWHVARWVARLVMLALALKTNYGLRVSYRERWSTTSRLRYFELQDATRFLKVHEQVIISSVTEWLDAHGIDASAFKDTITAFINQGVINTGQIGGSVATKVKAMVLRRPSKARAQRKAAA